jgi:DNA-binding MarR family transcriptional regulator
MQPGTAHRDVHVDEIAEALPQRSAALSRLFLRHTSICVSRTEVGVMRSLSARPRRITELAAEEHVTQPAITLLVNRLADRGWVQRQPDPADRRAVLVSLTEAGAEAFAQLRAEYRAMLHEEMATLEDGEIATLVKAIEILDRVIDRLDQRENPTRTDPDTRTS